MDCRIEFSHLKIKSILSARWPQLGTGLIVGTSHRSARNSAVRLEQRYGESPDAFRTTLL